MSSRVPLTRSQVMESMLYVNTIDKYSLHPVIKGKRRSMEFLREVIDCPSRKRVIIAGRQIGKSTMMAGESVAECITNPGFRVLYGAPDDGKIKIFSYQRLWPMIAQSPAVYRHYMSGKDCINNVKHKRFNNSSMIMLANSSNEDNMRSPSSDRINMDEIQSMGQDNIYVATKSMFTSQYKIISMSGTPLSNENPMEAYFRLSTQNQLMIPCHHCTGVTKAGSYVMKRHFWNSVGPKNISREGLICARCGKPIDVDDGKWVRFVAGAEYEGFRIPQPLSPFTDFEDLMDEWNNPNITLAKKMNEIFGISWDSSDRFLTEPEIRSACGEYQQAFEPSKLDPEISKYLSGRHVVAGIDWARNTAEGADTVLMIGVVVAPNDLRTVFIEKMPKGMPREEQTVVMIKKLQEFGVTFVVADWGAEEGRNRTIAKVIGKERMVQIYYTHGTTFVEKYHESVKLLTMNRTMCMSDLRDDLVGPNRSISLPRWEDTQKFANDFLVEYAEEDHWGKIRYDHPKGTNDDALHACVYMNIAKKLALGQPVLHMLVNAEPDKKNKK